MLSNITDFLTDAFANTQTLLFESVVQPIAFAVGAGNLLDVAFEGTGWLLVGLVQIAVMLCVIAPLEKWRPLEQAPDPLAVRADVIYTLIQRLGLFKLFMFFTFENAIETGFGVLRVEGFSTLNIDAIWPGVTDQAAVSFVLYLVVFEPTPTFVLIPYIKML